MKFFVVLFIIFFFTIINAFSYSLNDTFQVNIQSDGYRLGWNLSWAENCNQYGYYNKLWKLYKKILATNNPKFQCIKQGQIQVSQADESINCLENVIILKFKKQNIHKNKDEMEAIQQLMIEIKKNERANSYKEVRPLCKKFGFTATILKGALVKGWSNNEKYSN